MPIGAVLRGSIPRELCTSRGNRSRAEPSVSVIPPSFGKAVVNVFTALFR